MGVTENFKIAQVGFDVNVQRIKMKVDEVNYYIKHLICV